MLSTAFIDFNRDIWVRYGSEDLLYSPNPFHCVSYHS